MADKKHKPMTGPQGAYKRDGLGGVWKWAKGHGIKRWIKARNWAHRKAQTVTKKRRAAFHKAEVAYQKKLDWFHHHQHEHHADGDLVVMFDGKPCAKWMAVALQAARNSGIWGGTLLSGVRTVAESIALCQHICGHDSCPGLCAGAATNHTCPPSHKCVKPEGAVDVTDAAGFVAYCQSHGIPITGAGRFLPNDVNHCSHSGR